MAEAPILAGVIGSPIGHSKSPRLHGYWLQKHGINGHYIPMEVTAANLKTVLRHLPKAGFRGVNITLPHKEAALALADRITDRAALIGAANTLSFTADGAIQADNTDGYGFIENLHQYAPDWKPSATPALVLGAGGAARAVLSALLDAGVPRVTLANRTKGRAIDLAEAFGARVDVIEWNSAPSILETIGLLVNTTSLGMDGSAPLKFSIENLPSTALVTDIVYSPLRTDLLKAAEAKGCTTVDGLGMLLHQAVPGFHRWFGLRPEVTDELRQAVLAP